MRYARRMLLGGVALAVALAVSPVARAHWDGVTCKMHYPQLPDRNGWDIDMTTFTLADDFRCTESGLITGIHFWCSWLRDTPADITTFHASLHKNVSAADNPYGNYSVPGELVWEAEFRDYQIAPPEVGEQGWDSPEPFSNCLPDDHQNYWLVNLANIETPYRQVAGEVYWLDLSATVLDPAGGTAPEMIGWKTTFHEITMDAAVYATGDAAVPWAPIAVCTENRPTDLAFVITPEPATLALVGLGLAGLAAARRRRKG